jgi:thioredoxin-dependent peroxiredoxin
MAFLDRALGAVGLGNRGPVEVGQKAPDFSLKDSEGRVVTLAGLLSLGPVMLAFFPKAFTGGCTHELRAYTEQQGEIESRGAQLVAISTDDEPTLARFKASLGAAFPFLSDPGGDVASRYGGVSLGTANRITVTIGQDGVIKRITAGLPAIFPAGDIKACTRTL